MEPHSDITFACFDIDGTILTESARSLFSEYWRSIPEARRPQLIYNTGRAIADILPLFDDETIPRSHILIGGLGTEISYSGDIELAKAYREHVSWNWRSDRIRRWAESRWRIKLREPRWTTDLRLSWTFSEPPPFERHEIAMAFAMTGMSGQVVVAGTPHSFDIVPERAGKGAALQWLCDRIAVRVENVVVAGDEASDASMYQLRGLTRIILKDSHSALHRRWCSGVNFRTTAAGPAGVVEWLRRWREETER